MDAAATNWRTSLQADIRQNLVNMIMETLKNCFPDFGPEGLIKLNKLAEWFEKETYIDAKNKPHYLRKISSKIQNMEKIFETTGMPNTIQSKSVGSTQIPLNPGRPKYFWDLMDTATDRRISLQPDNRSCLADMIREILKNCFPDSGPERLAKLNKMAEWFEEESFIAATNNSDYLRRITLKILSMEKIFQTTGMLNTRQSNPAGRTPNPLAPASHGMQSQVRNQQKSLIPLPNQSQARRRIKPQHIQNTIVNARVQSSASLPSASYVTSLSQTLLSKAVCQSNNTQSGIAQNSVGSSVRQGIPSNVFSNLQYLYQQLQQQPLQHQILSSSIDSEAQTFHEVMYQKYQSMKEMHFPCLNDAYQKICIKCQQFDSRPNVSDSEEVERIKLYKNTLERLMQMLNVSRNNMVFVEKIVSYEEEMISFLSSNRPQKPISAQQYIRKLGDHPLSMQPQQQHQQQQHQQQLKPDNQMQPTNMQNSASKQSTVVTNTLHESIDSNAQTKLNAIDQQEEIYKKIQFMKEKYLPGLNEMYQNISIECEQHDDSLLNLPNSERIERLKLTKNMLELAVQILNMSKTSIVPAVRFISYKKVVLNIIRSNSPQIPVSVQQQVRQPGGHALSMQPQQQQHQHPNNPIQPSNMQKSVSSNQSTAVKSTCHASTDSKAQKEQNAVDQQEETYQKIQSIKKKYLPSLNEMYQQITINCQQPNSLPNVPKSKGSGKEIKKRLETAMKLLNASKDNTLLQKEQLATFEKVILCILSKGPRKPVSGQQQQQEEAQQQQQGQQQQQEVPQQQQPQQQEEAQQQQQEEAQQHQEAPQQQEAQKQQQEAQQ